MSSLRTVVDQASVFWKRKWISFRTFHISWRTWVKFDTISHDIMSLSYSENHSLLKRVIGNLHFFFTIVIKFGKQNALGVSTKMYWCRARRLSSRQATHIFCSYGLRNRIRLCVDLVTHHQKWITCVHYTPAFRENILAYPFCLTLFWGIVDWNVSCGKLLFFLHFLKTYDYVW